MMIDLIVALVTVFIIMVCCELLLSQPESKPLRTPIANRFNKVSKNLGDWWEAIGLEEE